jgi:cytoskeletal protein CcmA (bactofilin family)
MSMFGSKKNEEQQPQSAEAKLSMIAAGTTIDGNLHSEGDIRIEGRVIGTVVCKSRLVVGAKGLIEGNVDARNATVAGDIKGQVVIRETLALQETGRINGDILANQLAVQPGAVINGSCKMGPDAQNEIAKLPSHKELAPNPNGKPQAIEAKIPAKV